MGVKLSRVAKTQHTKKQYEHCITTILSGGLQKINRKIGKFLTLHQELLKQKSSLGTFCTGSVTQGFKQQACTPHSHGMLPKNTSLHSHHKIFKSQTI